MIQANQPLIYFITGASGVGKTSLVTQLKEKYRDGTWEFFHFDSLGVPSLEEMERDYGSGSEWQKAKTYEWIYRLINLNQQKIMVLEGQVNLQFIHDGFRMHNFDQYSILLLDCTFEEMTRRLVYDRGQPELVTEDMKNWLKYLRNQAITMNVPILDTSDLTEQEVVTQFEHLVGRGL